MKFTVDRVRFADAVAWVAKAADSAHSTTPILAGMLIDAAESGELHLSAYDYEMSSRAAVSAIVSEPGDCLVSAAVLGKLMAAADGDEVEVSCDDRTVTITCGRDVWDLALMNAYDYPSLPQIDEPTGRVSADDLAAAFKQVGPVVHRGKGAEIGHTGVYFDVEGDSLALVATDRVRLAATEIPWQSDDPDTYTAIVPPRLVADFCAAASGEVGVAFTRGHDGKVTVVALSCAGRVSTVRVIEASFPAWRNYFARVEEAVSKAQEAGTAAVVRVETDVLSRALTKAGAVIEDRSGAPAKLHIEVIPGKGLHLTGGDIADNLAKFDTEVEADVVGQQFPMLFMMSLLSGALSGLRCNQATLSIHGKVSPVLIQPVSDDSTHRLLLQPLRKT